MDSDRADPPDSYAYSSSPRGQFMKDNFEILATIGKGGYGSVMKVRHKMDGKIYALKKISTSNIEGERLEDVKKEVWNLSLLQHNNVVKYHSSWILRGNEDSPASSSQGSSDMQYSYHNSDSPTRTEQMSHSSTKDGDQFSRGYKDLLGLNLQRLDSNANGTHTVPDLVPFVYIQMEFCTNTLKQCIEENLYTEKRDVRRIVREMLSGLNYIHGQGIIHRDLKPENIFITNEGTIKIGDFGLSTRRPDHDDESRKLTGDIGSDLYMAPEVKNGGKYDQKCDLYSLGMIYFELIHPPFKTQSERIAVLNNLRKEEILFPPDWEVPDWETELKHIRRLLNHSPEKRNLEQFELRMFSELAISRKSKPKTRPKPYARTSSITK